MLGKDPKTYLPARNEPILARLGVTGRYVPGAVDRSFKAAGQSPEVMVERFRAVDPCMGAAVELGRVLYLRKREMVSFRPKEDFNPTTGRTVISHGTKGGRLRFGDGVVDPSAVRQAVEAAVPFANATTGSLIPDGFTRAQWMRRMQREAEKLGYTRRGLGVTLHSLRYTGAHLVYEDETGTPPPMAGGGPVSAEDDARARERLNRVLGHGIPAATDAYVAKGENPHPRREARGLRPSAAERQHLRHPFIRRRKRRPR